MRNRVVVLIFTHKPELAWQERIALEQCHRVLGNHPTQLVCPQGMDVAEYQNLAPNLQVDYIPACWLASVAAYNRLKLSPWLYRRYAEFDFMLTYELDAFVFRDELDEWCERGWDYIGAPWFVGFNNATAGAPYLGVGNSGFSLRRIKTMLRISTTWRCVEPTQALWIRSFASRSSLPRRLQFFAKAVLFNNFHFPFCPQVFEDYHWGIHAAKAFPEFRLAPIEDAARFSFEVNPERLFKECGGQLPFGCHKWMHYSPEFWLPRIREFGYSV